MSSTVDQIKDKLSITDVVSGYIKLERAGKNLKARCPFHNEKTPSFFVSPERNAYHCFGCNRGGDIFSFVQEFEGLDFMGALRVLADRAGVEITPIDPKAKSERERLFGLLQQATRYFQDQLKKNTAAQKYLTTRGLSDEIVEIFQLGYAEDAWRNLRDHFSKQGYTDEELIKVGLIKKAEKGKENYDTFRARIMFPIFDGAGRTIAFSGRLLSSDKTENAPKYLNTPETTFFSKSQVLYGLERAKQAMRKYDFAIVVEGQMDVLLAHMAGYANTIAPLGTALTGRHLDRIKQLSENIVFAFDADDAGLNSFQKAAHLALAKGFDVKVAHLPEGKDPADVIAANPREWKKTIKKALHAVDFLLAILESKHSDGRALKKAVRKTILPFVRAIENKIDQAHFIKRVAGAIGVSEEVIQEELAKVAVPLQETAVEESPAVVSETPHSRRDMALQRILGVLAWQEKVDEPLVSVEASRKRLSTLISKEDLTNFTRVAASSDERAFEAEVSLSDVASLDNHLEELFLVLEGELLQEELTQSLSELRKAESANDTTLVEKLLAKCHDLTQQIEQRKHALQQLQ